MTPTGFELLHFDSLETWRAEAASWDDLWRRSDCPLPTAQYEPVRLWLEQFAARRRFHALAVSDGQRLVAGMVFCGRRVGKLFEVGSLLTNDWCTSSDVLVDPDATASNVLDALVEGLAAAPWPQLWLDDVPLATPRWQELLAALERAGSSYSAHESFTIGQVEVAGPWQAFEASWSRQHRRSIRRSLTRAQREGPLELRRYPHLRPADVEPLVRRAFEIEDRGWKADQGTSVLRVPGVFDFYCRQARELAERDQLDISFLESAGRTVAFEFGYRAKGVYFSPKVGYDEAFAAFKPGQLLRRLLLEALWLEGEVRWVDFWGLLTPATRSWSTRSYPMGRVVVATRAPGARALLAGYRLARRASLPWRRATRSEPAPSFVDGADVGDANAR